MKRYFLVCLLVMEVGFISAQKKLIDSTVFGKWPALNSPKISTNGKFVVFRVEDYGGGGHAITVQATENRWKKEIAGRLNPQFTEDSRWLIYKLNPDSLCLLELGKENIQYYPHIMRYEVGGTGLKQWIAMQQSGNGGNDLLLRDLTKGTVTIFPGVIDFVFSKNGKSLIIQRADQSKQETVLELINTETGKSSIVCKKESQAQFHNITFDPEGKQVVFLATAKNKNPELEKSGWYYQVGMEQAVKKLTSQTPGMPKGVEISKAEFSLDGSRLFFEASEVAKTQPKRSEVNVDIWSYTDEKLQPQQLQEVDARRTYKGVINLNKNEAIILQGLGEQLYDNEGKTDSYSLLTATYRCFVEENNWRSSCRIPLYLVSTKDGSRRLVKDSMVFSDWSAISPDSKFVVYFDPQKQAYFSYSVETGNTVNITQNVPFPIVDIPFARAGLPKPYSWPQFWLPGKGLIINDEYDLWLLDPKGTNAPVCLTNGYGRANGIRYKIFSRDRVVTESQITLLAFRPSDKSNGFYSLNLNKPADPQLLTMGPSLYSWYLWSDGAGEAPIKAKGANSWVVRRESASEFPNYFATKDFKSFVRLTNIQPQSNYNWLTAELHEWTMFDGKRCQGILYKPENFDPKKKYPVIFHFYEEKSDELHKYFVPGATEHNINIPHFVSNGYLVFVADIHYVIGQTRESVYNSVGSAAKYLSSFSWIDSSRMGLQGHSLGGYEVHALISRTNMFAAAASAAGASDLVSNTGSVNITSGYSLAYLAELTAYRIGGTIWEKKNEYIQNSPVFFADQIKTPLLMFNCKEDHVVPFGQGTEMFLALRRMDKQVWMLQYDNGQHQLGGKDAEDYTIRLMQFFDHYLKGAPPPKWLTQGIPARLKGIETGYELDPNGSCGKDCKICKEKKYK